MMRLFIYEFTCGPGLRDDPGLRALQTEGRAMLTALLEDFGRVPEVAVTTLLSEPQARELRCRHGNGWDCRVGREADEEGLFRELAGAADYSLVVAPESDDLLRTRCRWVEEAGGRLLGPGPEAVRLTGDKLAVVRLLRDHGLPTPATRPFVGGMDLATVPFPAVYKPRFGAGSQATFLLHHPGELPACLAAARAEGWQGEALLQPFVPGQPASVVALTGPGRSVPLLPATQILSKDGRFHYAGGLIPLAPHLAARATRLAGAALSVIAGLRGYVGVDVVLGPADDGSQDAVIEINPRLTTSYVGLRALAEVNLAEVLLGVVTGQDVPPVRWRPGAVRFYADGRIESLGESRR